MTRTVLRPKIPTGGSETALVKSLLSYLPLAFKDRLTLWRLNTGATQTATGAFLRFGVVGAPDLLGILSPAGRFVGIECKSAKGKVSTHQKDWLLRAAKMGALVGVVRTMAEAEEMLSTGECRLAELQEPVTKEPLKKTSPARLSPVHSISSLLVKPEGAERLSFNPPHGSACYPVWVDANGDLVPVAKPKKPHE